jgi:hypothetical protein
MKAPVLNLDKRHVPSLFQIASYFEDFFPPAGIKKSAPTFRQMPFAHVMMHPGKLKAVLAPAKVEDRAARPSSTKRPPRNTPKTNTGNGDGKSRNNSSPEAKSINFSLKAPAAKSVKLVADFTNWEKSPLDLKPSRNGLWTGAIPLTPGKYSYRFIVDGQWCDDPLSTQRVPNPFGTENAVVVVI